MSRHTGVAGAHSRPTDAHPSIDPVARVHPARRGAPGRGRVPARGRDRRDPRGRGLPHRAPRRHARPGAVRGLAAAGGAGRGAAARLGLAVPAAALAPQQRPAADGPGAARLGAAAACDGRPVRAALPVAHRRGRAAARGAPRCRRRPGDAGPAERPGGCGDGRSPSSAPTSSWAGWWGSSSSAVASG